MSYEIPPPLQHKEKIIFGLTFEQLLYAGVAVLLDATILKAISNTTVKFTLITIVSVTAIVFMFFQGKDWIKNIYHFLKFRRADVYSKSMQQYIGISSITGNYIINAKNQKIALVEVQPVNFNIKTEGEQEAIMLGFQKFLNSIDFPVQILIASENISLNDHFTSLQKKLRNGFDKLFKDYQDFITNSISVNDIKNRKFYIIIKERNNINIETSIVEEKLRNIGLNIRRIETISEKNNPLLRSVHDFFNQGHTKTIKAEGEIVDKDSYITSPEEIINKKDHLVINNCLNRIIAANGYPNSVGKGFLDKIISNNDNFDISIHIDPFPIDFMLIQLNNELKKQRADMYTDTLKGMLNPSLEIKYAATRKTLEELQKGRQKLFNVSLYINCKTKRTEAYALTNEEIKKIKETTTQKPKEKDEHHQERIRKILTYKEHQKPYEELDLLSRKISSELNSLMIQPRTPLFRQSDAYKSMMPLAEDKLKLQRNIATEALSAFFPFTSPFLSAEPEGIMLGLNKNKIPFIKDIYKLTNANGLILATSGGGKSYFTKLLLTRLFMQGTKILIIDPQGEYAAVTKECNGQIITISKDSQTIINPLDLMGHAYEDKRLQLVDLFKIMLGDLTEVQKGVLDKAINETYADCGIDKGTCNAIQPPRITDLYTKLQSMEKAAENTEKTTYNALINRLYVYTEQGVFGFLDKQTNINFTNDFVCFNIGFMPKQVKPVIMFLVLDYIYTRMKRDITRKLLVLDEAWSLLARAEEEGYIFEIVKTCRKFNLGLLMITQDVADLVNSKAGHAALANSSYTFLLRQKPAVIDSVSKVFNLSPSEKNYLLTCNIGNGLLILDNEHQELEIKASNEEHALITTNPDEILEQEKAKNHEHNDKTVIKIELNTKQPYYATNKLTLEEIHYLKNHGYGIARYHTFETAGNPNEYLIKETPPESLLHSFVTAITYDYIKTKTDKVERHLTLKPDILFTDKKGKQHAIEIETGIHYKDHKERLQKKFANLKREYGNRGIILLTDKSRIKIYHKYGIRVIGRYEIKHYIDTIFSKQ